MITLLLLVAAQPLIERTPSILFCPPVTLAARFGGFRPSLVAAVLSILSLDRFFIEPRHALNTEDPSDALSLVVFVLVALLVSSPTGVLRTAHSRAEAATTRPFAEPPIKRF